MVAGGRNEPYSMEFLLPRLAFMVKALKEPRLRMLLVLKMLGATGSLS